MTRLLWVCLGGALGTGARYLLAGWVGRTLGPGFPAGTLSVNLLGSFVLAALMAVSMHSDALPRTALLALTTGAMGGFTTYSTFSFETYELLKEGSPGLAALNVAITLLACLAACWLGFVCGRALATSGQ